MDYQNPYSLLFNAITDALRAMEAQNFGVASELLKKAQQNAEAAYLDIEE